MGVPVVINQAVDGGPALSEQAGSLYTVLKTHAVALGLSIAYDDPATSKIVLQNTAGLGHFIRVVDDSAHHPGAGDDCAYVKCFTAMTDIDTGTGEYFEGYWPKNDFNGAKTYIIASDGKTLHMFPRSHSQYHSWISWGDMGLFFSGDNRAALAAFPTVYGGASSSYVAPFRRVRSTSFNSAKVSADRAGNNSTVGALWFGEFSAGSDLNFYQNALPSEIGVQRLSSPIYAGVPTALPDGAIRGILKPINSDIPSAATEIAGIKALSGPATCLEIPCSTQLSFTGESGSIYLDISSDWDSYDAA